MNARQTNEKKNYRLFLAKCASLIPVAVPIMLFNSMDIDHATHNTNNISAGLIEINRS